MIQQATGLFYPILSVSVLYTEMGYSKMKFIHINIDWKNRYISAIIISIDSDPPGYCVPVVPCTRMSRAPPRTARRRWIAQLCSVSVVLWRPLADAHCPIGRRPRNRSLRRRCRHSLPRIPRRRSSQAMRPPARRTPSARVARLSCETPAIVN